MLPNRTLNIHEHTICNSLHPDAALCARQEHLSKKCSICVTFYITAAVEALFGLDFRFSKVFIQHCSILFPFFVSANVKAVACSAGTVLMWPLWKISQKMSSESSRSGFQQKADGFPKLRTGRFTIFAHNHICTYDMKVNFRGETIQMVELE